MMRRSQRKDAKAQRRNEGIWLRTCILILCVLASSAHIFAGDDWPQFRGPDGQGHSDSTGLPIKWSATENIAWSVEIPGRGWSSPVILGNQIWLTTATEDGKSLRAICVDREKGKIVRDIEVFRIETLAAKHNKNSYASPSPVIESDRVYVHFGTYGTACLSTSDGAVVWKNDILKIDHEVGPGSSPVIFGDLLILTMDGTDKQFIAALDKKSGEIRWKNSRPPVGKTGEMSKAFCTPLVYQVAGQNQMVIPGADRVIAYDPENGEEIWQVDYNGFSNVPRPVFAHGLVYVCTGFQAAELLAIRPTGKGNVTQSEVAWKFIKQVPNNPSPVIVGDLLFMVSDRGIATCLDAKTGEEIWRERLEGEFTSSLLAAEGNIYLTNEEGKTFVIAAERMFRLVSVCDLGEKVMASFAVSGKALYLRSETRLFRIEK